MVIYKNKFIFAYSLYDLVYCKFYFYLWERLSISGSFLCSTADKNFISIFIVIAFFFSALTISEIFEDYIKDQKIKNVANKVLNIFAIIMPLITITGIYNLS